jgi:hypothetical protein
LGLSLDQKKIGLLQKEGMALIVFNMGYPRHIAGEGRRDSLKFARRAARQGRRLPAPDLVLASTPPLAINGPAHFLSCFYKAPLVMELREAAGVPGRVEGNMLNKLLVSPLQRSAHKAFLRAESIIATSPEAAQAARELAPSGKTVHLLPDDLTPGTLFQKFGEILEMAGRACDK